jgi:hypothetical protein
MPGTDQEYLDYAVSDGVMPLRWLDRTWVTPRDRLDLTAIRDYHRAWTVKQNKGPQHRALKFLRSLLSPEQRKQLRAWKGFYVTAPSGRQYRLWPQTGNVERVTTHGKRRYKAFRFCLHDDPGPDGKRVPPADLSIAHMLWLTVDEAGFLEKANATDTRDQLWNRAYLRRLREARTALRDVPAVQGTQDVA